MPTPQLTELARLRSFLLRESVRFGKFTLASGKVSDVYVDGKLTTLTADAMPLIGRAFIQKMRDNGWLPEAVGGLTLGADPIAFSISRESLDMGPAINAFVVRKEPKKHGMQRFIEGLENAEGKKVVIIDDVCTTGGSTAQAIEKAKAAGMDILGALCLVDREMGAGELLRREYRCALGHIFTLSELRPEHDGSHTPSAPVETSS